MSADPVALLEEAQGVRACMRSDPELLVVQETPAGRNWLACILGKAFPGAAMMFTSSVRAAQNLVREHFFDITLIDLELPDSSGIEILQSVARFSPLTRCVITTVFDDDAHVMPALSAGAVGYLLRDQPEPVLIEQLRLLAQGVPPLAPSVARRLVRHFAVPCSGNRGTISPPPAEDDLSPLSNREKEVLGLIARGLHITDVSRALKISTHTVCSHIKSIYRKRSLCSRAEAALEAKRLGLV